jgi:hypothetical protein
LSNVTYESKWKLFSVFAATHSFDPFKATAAQVAEFLVHVASERSAAIRTLAGYRSAIANVLKLTCNRDVGQDPLLSQLMKSFKRTQPVPSQRIPCWDVCLVLHVLCSEKATDDKLSEFLFTAKVVFLLALGSGDRCGALAALVVPFRVSESGIVIDFRDKFVPKSYFLKRNLTRILPLAIPRVNTESLRQVCPCSAVESYCERVAGRRHVSQTSLIIPHQVTKTHNIKPQSLARYIKAIVGWCYEQEGESTPMTRAHDVRKVATSLRELTSLSLSDLLGAGDWSQPSTLLKHYKFLLCTDKQRELVPFEGVVAAKSRLSLQRN